MSWDQTRSAAMAAFGSKAKIPDPKVNVNKLHADYDAARKGLTSTIDVLQTKILQLQNAMSSARNMLKQYEDLIDNEDFGLDEEKDKDKIAKGSKLIDDFLDDQMEWLDGEIKKLDELDKHSMAIAKFK